MTAVWQRHPLATVLGLEIGAIALTVVGALALSTLWPGLPGYSVTGPSQSLILVNRVSPLREQVEVGNECGE